MRAIPRKILAACLISLLTHTCIAQEVLTQPPAAIDPGKKYLFFLHGLSVEQQGPDAYSREFQKVNQTTAVAQTLANLGYIVLTEARQKGTRVQAYSEKITRQVQQLITAGVVPKNIALVGHSKGGYIAIAAATKLANPDISYALLAGCTLPTVRNISGVDARATYETLVAAPQGQLVGRFLSLYDSTDAWMGTCEALKAANPKIDMHEMTLQSGLPAGMGHSLFYAPEPVWINPLKAWLKDKAE